MNPFVKCCITSTESFYTDGSGNVCNLRQQSRLVNRQRSVRRHHLCTINECESFFCCQPYWMKSILPKCCV